MVAGWLVCFCLLAYLSDSLLACAFVCLFSRFGFTCLFICLCVSVFVWLFVRILMYKPFVCLNLFVCLLACF